MRRYSGAVLSLAKALCVRWLRDPTALFLLLALPLIFLLVLGAFSRTNGASFSVALINDAHSQLATQVAGEIKTNQVFKLKQVTSLDDAKQKLGRGEVDGIVLLPANFGTASGAAITYYQ